MYSKEFADWRDSLPSYERGRLDALLLSGIVRQFLTRLFDYSRYADIRSVLRMDSPQTLTPAKQVATMIDNCNKKDSDVEFALAVAAFSDVENLDPPFAKAVIQVISNDSRVKLQSYLNP